MKKLLLVIMFCSFIFISNNFAQKNESAWAVGFGFSYPRLASVDVGPKDPNYGGFVSIQRNFNEKLAIRVLGFYRSMLGKVPSVLFKEAPGGGPSTVPANWEVDEMTTTSFGGIFDVIYYFTISKSMAPFVHFGGGFNYYDPDYTKDGIYNKTAKAVGTGVFDLGVGSEFEISDNWKFKVDFSFNLTDGGIDGIQRKPDGYNDRSGIFGTSGDSYISVDFGLLYYFGKKEIPKRNMPTGIIQGERVDYEKIKNIVKSYIPKEVVREVIVEKPVNQKSNWVLVGVNFAFNSAELKPESYPILFHAVKVLKANPEIYIEIVGHSDNLGDEKFNIDISERRAETVKNYLVGKGINSNRLSVVGKGSSEPISDNTTAVGRAMNRRIEFNEIK